MDHAPRHDRVAITSDTGMPPPLKITHVVRQFHPGIGGMENYVEQLATRQAAIGHDVRVATLDRVYDDVRGDRLPGREDRHGVRIVRNRFFGSRRYPLAPGVLRTLRGADVVHVHGVDFFADYLAATRAFHRKPLVLSTHGGFFHTSFARRLKQLYLSTITRSALSQFAAVVACSAEDRRRFADVVDTRLLLIPNPVDIEKFAGIGDAASDTVIYFGRLARNKEIAALMSWFAGLAERDPAVSLIIAGKPMGVEPDTLRAHADRLGLEGRWELHLTPSDDELRALIARSGTCACASSYEGFGLAAVEAASAGLFPLLSAIPPFADTLDRLGYGMSVDFQDRGGWPQSYRDLAERRGMFRETFDADRIAAAVAPFDWVAAVPRFDALYRQVLGTATRTIGAVRVTVTGRDAATRQILSAARQRSPELVTFCNADTVNLAARDAAFGVVLDRFLVLNDGIGVQLASRGLYGRPFPENLNGTDFTPFLLGAADRPLALYVIGSAPGVAEDAAGVIEARFPLVSVVGTQHGFFDQADEPMIAAAIRASGADLVLAAMGQPRQELWAARNAADLGCPVICVGALLDFLSDRVSRAPQRIRRMRLEWAFRLAQEPRRLARRYLLGNATFALRVLAQKAFGGRYHADPAAPSLRRRTPPS